MTATPAAAGDDAALAGHVESAARRFSDLVETVRRPDARVTQRWSITDAIAHVRSVASLDAFFVGGREPGPRLSPLVDQALADTAGTHAAFTESTVAWAGERTLAELAAGVVAEAEDLAASLRARRRVAPVPWLGGMRLPAAAVGAHLISEVLVHGVDIAAAEGRRFDVPDAEARHFFEAFVPHVLVEGWQAGFFDGASPGAAPVRWRFRVRGGATTAFALAGDSVTRVDPADGPFDLTISGRPGVMLLVVYGRIPRSRAALRGQVAVWGRRPWRLSRVGAAVHTL